MLRSEILDVGGYITILIFWLILDRFPISVLAENPNIRWPDVLGIEPSSSAGRVIHTKYGNSDSKVA